MDNIYINIIKWKFGIYKLIAFLHVKRKKKGSVNFSNIFDKFCELPMNNSQTFSQLLIEKIDKIGVETFSRKTLLNGKKLLADCKKNPEYKPKMRILMSIAMGLKSNKDEFDSWLSSAGRVLEPTDKTSKAYLFLIHEYGRNEFTEILVENSGNVIITCNQILKQIGIENDKDLLGQRTYKSAE